MTEEVFEKAPEGEIKRVMKVGNVLWKEYRTDRIKKWGELLSSVVSLLLYICELRIP